MGEMRNAHRIVGKPKEKKQLWRPRLGWEDSFKIYLKQGVRV
jgi:hypothetical protein